MARAKRTDRSEARRRYRALVAAESAIETEETSGSEAGEDEGEVEPNRLSASVEPNRLGGRSSDRPTDRAAKGRRLASPLDTQPAAPARPGIFGAFSSSVRPLDLRGDLAAAPAIIRHRATWIPAAITVVCGVIWFVPALRDNAIGALVLPLVITPPPMAMPFLAGLLAPRASWIAGALVSLLGGLFYSAWVLTVDVSTLQSKSPVSQSDRLAAVGYALAVSLVFGGFIAAFAAFYKRFLRLSSPASGRGGSKSGRAKATNRPAARRR